MQRSRGTLTAITLALVVSGCSAASKGDTVACETFTDSHNLMIGAASDGSGADFVRETTGWLQNSISDALLVVEDPNLKISLTKAQEMAPGLLEGNQDIGTAYFLITGDIFETCQELGVDVEKVDPTA